MIAANGKTRQLIILSGKGGTGKTSLCAAFAHLVDNSQVDHNAVFVDADVDAANLSLVLRPEESNRHEFWGGSLAEIDFEICTGCGACVPVCRYDAVLPDVKHDSAYWIDPVACDGCAACVYACPEGAIKMVQQQEGHWFQSKTSYGDLFHAELFPGKENSGKLVTLVRQHARLWAEEAGFPLVVIDGPPGIGCPVISACAGADLGLIVSEPGQAGFHDLKRVLATLQHFRVPSVICINKADIYPEGAEHIRAFALEQGIPVVGEIPFDENIPRAMLQGAPITRVFPESPSAKALNQIWKEVRGQLLPEKEPYDG